jgi:hypothetical protein
MKKRVHFVINSNLFLMKVNSAYSALRSARPKLSCSAGGWRVLAVAAEAAVVAPEARAGGAGVSRMLEVWQKVWWWESFGMKEEVVTMTTASEIFRLSRLLALS